MTAEHRLLLRLLGWTDALWFPNRKPVELPLSANLLELRREYPERGVPYASLERTTAKRKEAMKLVDAMREQGKLVPYAPSGKTVSARLTDRGEFVARRLLGMPVLHETITTLRLIASLHDGYVPEIAIRGLQPSEWDGDTDTLYFIEEHCVPGLIRGWVESSTTVGGHAFYRITPEGRRAIETDPEAPEEDVEKLGDVETAYYLECRDAADAAYSSRTPNSQSECGPCPMSMGGPYGGKVAERGEWERMIYGEPS